MDKKLIAIIGAAVIVVGLFLPVVSSVSSISLLIVGEHVSWVGLFVLACSVLGVVLAFLGMTRHAVWPGIVVLGFLLWQYLEVKSRLDNTIYGADAVSMMAGRMPQINILGWAVMGAGALIMIAAGAMAWKGSSAPAA